MIGLVFLLTFFSLLLPSQVYAYLDPGTGSYIVQIIIASLVGGLYLFARSWKGFKKFVMHVLSKLFGRGEVPPSSEH